MIDSALINDSDSNNEKSKEENLDESVHINNVIISNSPKNSNKLHRVVLTGGPCSGKSTSLTRIRNFFENIGWKVFCVPETATILLSTGFNFYDLNKEAKINFQENLLKCLLRIEDTINDLAKFYLNKMNCLIIYDRGAMDPISYLEQDEWNIIKQRNPSWNEVDLRDNRYDQIIHLITAAKGASHFYTLENNKTRTENIDMAKELDDKCVKTWLGHPKLDIIDNHLDFESKVSNTLKCVCERIGLGIVGLGNENKKHKYLVEINDEIKFLKYKELEVFQNFLLSNLYDKVRIKKIGDGENWSYSYSTSSFREGQLIQTRAQINKRDYSILSKAIDPKHNAIVQKRRCFIWHNRYFRLDIFQEPNNGLALLSTRFNDENNLILPEFLTILKDVTNDPNYFVFNLSLKKNQ